MVTDSSPGELPAPQWYAPVVRLPGKEKTAKLYHNSAWCCSQNFRQLSKFRQSKIGWTTSGIYTGLFKDALGWQRGDLREDGAERIGHLLSSLCKHGANDLVQEYRITHGDWRGTESKPDESGTYSRHRPERAGGYCEDS